MRIYWIELDDDDEEDDAFGGCFFEIFAKQTLYTGSAFCWKNVSKAQSQVSIDLTSVSESQKHTHTDTRVLLFLIAKSYMG